MENVIISNPESLKRRERRFLKKELMGFMLLLILMEHLQKYF